MDHYQKLTDVDIFESFENLKQELVTELFDSCESSKNEAVHSNASENISCSPTGLECEREVDFTTSQNIYTEECNSISELPKYSSSSKADLSYMKSSMHEYDMSEVDNIRGNVGCEIFPDSKHDIISNIDTAGQFITCKDEELSSTMDLNNQLKDKANTSENISCSSTGLECEREVDFTTSQNIYTEEYNSISELPKYSSSSKADLNYKESSMHEYDICEADNICGNVGCEIFPDSEPDVISNIGTAEQFITCKDKELSSTKTGEKNFTNLINMDLNKQLKDKANTRKKVLRVMLPNLTSTCGKSSGNQYKKTLIQEKILKRIFGKEAIIVYKCYHCKKSFARRHDLKNHLKIHSETRCYECPHCKNKFNSRLDLRAHLRIHEGIRPFECLQCKKRFTHKGHLRKHLRIHEGIRPFECLQCKKRFTYKGHLTIHLRIHEEISPFECLQCKKRFPHKGHLMRHLRIHEQSRSYECPQCKKKFTQNGKLNKHLIIHHRILPFECPVCKQRFAQNSNLNEHLRSHGEIRPYECPQCKKKFTQNGTLKKHLIMHDIIPPFECPVCKQRFVRNSHLDEHLRSHGRIRPYECAQCKKLFSRSRNLKNHLMIHKKCRPYKCPQCKKGFIESETLNTHLKIHQRIRPYESRQCKEIQKLLQFAKD